jgi:rubrerythrin
MVEDIMKNMDELTANIKTIEDGVQIALTIEKQGHDFYINKSETSVSIVVKDLFTYLAAEENRHIQYLNDFITRGKVSTIQPPDFIPSFAGEFLMEKTGEMDVLMGALSFENKNEHFYKELARKTDDPSQKEFFDAMANFEHGHLELIDGLIEEATQFRMQT